MHTKQLQTALQACLGGLSRPPLAVHGPQNGVVCMGISQDSRRVVSGGIYVAQCGTHKDGHSFIPEAIVAGANTIVCERMPEQRVPDVTYVQVHSTVDALGEMASAYYGYPSHKLQVVAITGTNGKSSVVNLLHALFLGLGYRAGLCSTLVNKVHDTSYAAVLTTPDAVCLQQLLYCMVQEGCTHCFMEATSHALMQGRLSGTQLAGGVFTNITHDHLDYHGSFQAYLEAKQRLFTALPPSAFALCHVRDRNHKKMTEHTKATPYGYGLGCLADFTAKVLQESMQGMELSIDGVPLSTQLIGEPQAQNLLAVYGVATLLGVRKDALLVALSALHPVEGRLEVVAMGDYFAVVDYAHTPDALDKVLETLAGVHPPKGRIITVVGCGGGRDTHKRPIMGKIAARGSCTVFLTSDNPRYEDPASIAQAMQEGLTAQELEHVHVVLDRKQAIEAACRMAQKNDVVLVAGRGHEAYQDVAGVRSACKDRDVLMHIYAAQQQAR